MFVILPHENENFIATFLSVNKNIKKTGFAIIVHVSTVILWYYCYVRSVFCTLNNVGRNAWLHDLLKTVD